MSPGARNPPCPRAKPQAEPGYTVLTRPAQRWCSWVLRVILLMSLFACSRTPLALADDAGTAPAPGRLRITAKRQIFSPNLGLYQFFGDVAVTSDTLNLRAAEMSYDAASDLVLARGDVALTGEDGQTLYGSTLEYHPRAHTWVFHDWNAALPPELVGKPLLTPLYVTGASLSPGKKDGLELDGATLTTCDLEHPHYALAAREVVLFPGDKLIARDVEVYVHERRLLRLPWMIFLLGTRRLPIVPEVGRNDTEGYFVRLPYQYLLNADNLGLLRLDVTEKRGLGLGIDHFYTLASGNGEAFAYLNSDEKDYTLRLRHTQPLPADIALNLDLERRRTSTNGQNPTLTTNVLARLQRNTAHTNSSLEYGDNTYDGSLTTSVQRLNLHHELRTRDSALSYQGEYQNTRYGDQAADQELWHHLQMTRRTGFGEAKLRVDQRTDVDGTQYSGDNTAARFERLPELTLQTANRTLGLGSLPGQLLTGWGLYRERADKDPVGRFVIDWQATPTLSPSKQTSLFLSTGFRQSWYGDDDRTAQYTWHADLNGQLRLGNLTSTLTYGVQRVEGFTPLNLDTVSNRHDIQQSVLYQTPTLRLALTGGRDLRWQRWNDLAFTAEGTSREGLTWRQTLGYDPNAGAWRDAVSQFAWQVDPKRAVSLRTRYDLEHGRMRGTSAQLRWNIADQWGVQWQAEHDGSTFFRNEVLVTRDLHCWEAALRYDIERGAFGLSLRPKAFDPGVVPGFSIGDGRWDLGVSTSF